MWLKREDLLHTGAHKINNALGQALLAQRMGKTRIIAETGAGQHGVATATACALLGLECVVYMGTEDMRRQRPNVERMRLLGARSCPVEAGRAHAEGGGERGDPRLGRQRRATPTTSSARPSGPAPYPALVRDLQRVIGDEARAQVLEAAGRAAGPRDRLRRRRLQRDRHVHRPSSTTPRSSSSAWRRRARGSTRAATARRSPTGARGVLHGALSAVLQDEEGQILEAHSVSAGLDYPGSGPEHAYLRDSGRVRYVARHRRRGAGGLPADVRLEGIVPALEPRARDRLAARRTRRPGAATTCVTLSGRGDKDLAEVLGLEE